MRTRLVGSIWGLIVTAILIAVPLSFRDRLPDPIATHWSDRPDGATSLVPFVLTTTLIWVAVWVVLLGIAIHGKMLERSLSRAYWWGALVWSSLFVIGMAVTTVYANLGRAGWTQAELPGWIVTAVLIGSIGAGLAAGFLGKGGPDQPPPAGETPPRLRLREGQRSVWVSRVSNPWLAAMDVFSGVVAVTVAALGLIGALPAPVWGIVLAAAVLIFVAGLLTSAATVRVTGDGVAIGFGLLGWPVRRIRLSKIEKAWSENRYPSQVGGWGLRGVPGMAAIMLRGGECLVLRYRSGGQLLISVDDARRGASLLNALIEERAA
ncbi:DUF1648 domain-containing protein [Nonomuraea typhae]|uniref:DUF1648 domain-containing protein n=1 Tax=Nonomuraea typhae TaxID=2603600 RepID=UPI0012FA3F8D|nr:DUF1648 domain-containing protein [Nonomuraea typhae]